MTYTPADAGLAKYFLSMLDDADRNGKAYGDGIEACIKEFVEREGRKHIRQQPGGSVVYEDAVGTGHDLVALLIGGSNASYSMRTDLGPQPPRQCLRQLPEGRQQATAVH